MKYSFLIMALMSVFTLGAQNPSNLMDSLSYSLGVLVAQNLQSQGFNEINSEEFTKAVTDVFEQNDLPIDVDKANEVVQSYFQQQQSAVGDANAQAGKVFLEQNAKRSAVSVTDSGLQYEVLTEGDGPKPAATDKVTVHYTGTLIDGTVFDSSVQRGEPASFPVNAVIPGWVEALQMMPVGSKWKLYIPSELAYGPNGAGDVIGPNATLIFEVELLEIN